MSPTGKSTLSEGNPISWELCSNTKQLELIQWAAAGRPAVDKRYFRTRITYMYKSAN